MKGRDPLKDVLCSLEYGVLYLGWKRALFWAGAFGMIFGFGGLFVWLLLTRVRHPLLCLSLAC